MKVVLDTNIFWVSVPRRAKTNWVFREMLKGSFDLYVSSDILQEYEEIVGNRLSKPTADVVMETLENLRNVFFTNIYYRWQLITADPDDDKFVDCAVAGGCDYIVTNDQHFNVLKTIDFPPVKVINLEEFKILLNL